MVRSRARCGQPSRPRRRRTFWSALLLNGAHCCKRVMHSEPALSSLSRVRLLLLLLLLLLSLLLLLLLLLLLITMLLLLLMKLMLSLVVVVAVVD